MQKNIFRIFISLLMLTCVQAQTYIATDATIYRGKVILVVDKTIISDAQVAGKLERLTQDLIGDGWRVLRHDVERGPEVPRANRPPFTSVNGFADWEQQNAVRVREVRALIKADFDAAPNEVKNVFLIGHVPAPYSGHGNAANVGGHYVGAKPSDAFYGDMNSPYGSFGWSDVLTAPASYVLDVATGLPKRYAAGDSLPNGHQIGDIVINDNTGGNIYQCDNYPQDGKFDQDLMPSPMKLGVGRVDFFRMNEFGMNEATLISRYLDKDHDFRCGNFQVQRRAIFAGQLSVDTTGANQIFANNVNQFYNYSDNINSVYHWLWFPNVKNNGQDYLIGYGGGVFGGYCTGIGSSAWTSPNDFLSSDSRVVFVSLGGSFMGNWESEVDFLRAPLANPYDPANGRFGYGLTSIYSQDNGFGLDAASLIKRALGAPIGEALFKDYTGDVNHPLMGDPTLRMHTVLSPNTLTISISGNAISLNWAASTDVGVTGYNIYRAPTQNGPYVQINSGGPITGTSYQTTRQTGDVPDNFYMVRAVKNETVSTIGTYLNMSEGAPIKVSGLTTPYLSIQNQPISQHLMANTPDGVANSVAFTVDAVGCDSGGNGQLFYQWYKDDIAVSVNDCHIKGANTRSLLIMGLQTSDVGNYHVVVSNNKGSATSSSASLTVVTSLPTALPDSVNVYRNTPGDINVLANDTSGFTSAIKSIVAISALSDSKAGTISINSDQTVHFTPTRTFLGPVTFTYIMTDGVNRSQATVTVNVLPLQGNQPPSITFVDGVSQIFTERTAISLPFTLTDDHTTAANLVESLTCSSQDVICQVTGTGSSRTLHIAADLPANNITVTLTYTDEDAAITTTVFHVTVLADQNVPALSGATYSASGNAFAYNINGTANSTWTVYSSVDLINWTATGSVTLNGSGAGSYTDNGVSGLTHRFYKLSNGTYTSHAIGFERVTVPHGQTYWIANQLVAPNQSFAGLFDPMPDGNYLPNGMAVGKWSGAGYDVYEYGTVNNTWLPINNTPAGHDSLAPGEGAFVYNPSQNPVTFTFVGLVSEGQHTTTLVNGYNVVSSFTPQAGGVQTLMGYQPTSGDYVIRANNITYDYFNEPESGFPAGWYDDDTLEQIPEPTFGVGEGFVIVNGQGFNETRTQNFTPVGGNVPSLSGATYSASGNAFAYNINGTANSTWTVYSSVDLINWTAVQGLTLNNSGAGSFTDNSINGLMYKFYKLSDGTHTSYAIGFERVTVPHGQTYWIANQLVAPNQSFAGLFDPMPDGNYLPNGMAVDKWNGSGYDVYVYGAANNTWSPMYNTPVGHDSLSPGEGAFVYNPSQNPVTFTFVGLVSEGQHTTTLVNGYNVVSSFTPQAGGVQTLMGYQPTSGDYIIRANNVYYDYLNEPESGFPAGWYDDDTLEQIPEPTFGVGEGFVIVNGQGFNETRTQNFTPVEGNVPALVSQSITAGSFTFTASGSANSTWEIYSSTDLKNWTAAGSVTLNSSGAGTFTDNSINGLMYKFYKLSNGTYTSHTIGFEHVTVPHGQTYWIANQLVAPNQSFAGLFDPMPDGNDLPDGMAVDKWNGSGYDVYVYGAANNIWSPLYNTPAGRDSLAPGEGAFVYNPSQNPVTFTFVGLVSEGQHMGTLVNGYNVVSSFTPQAGGIQSLLGYQPTSGDYVIRANNITYDYFNEPGSGFPAGWYDDDMLESIPEPAFGVGEGFVIVNGQGFNETRTQNFTPR